MIPIFAYKKLYPSLREHRQVEASLRELLPATLEPQYIAPQSPGARNPLAYIRKNFFSILFLAVYRAIGIPPERRLLYGAVNHCLRGIVTGTDNLLDSEYKELLPLAFPAEAIRFKSVMHILLFDRFLFTLARRMQTAGFCPDPEVLLDALLRALVPIGAEEAREEGGISQILPPEEILSSVHMYKGGRLLCLAFVAPRLLETELTDALRQSEEGIYRIGMALQMLDDLTDLHEDIGAGNHNYLVSAIHYDGLTDERQRLAEIRATGQLNGQGIGILFPATVRRVMEDAISEALAGFALLEQAGFWFSPPQADLLIRHLFELRGLTSLLSFYPEPPALGAATLS